MFLRLESIEDKLLAGMHIQTSLVENKIGLLWSRFMPRRGEIADAKGTNLFSVAIYTPDYFTPFNPAKEFTRWAAVEVNTANNLPEGMDIYTLPAGEYAVFLHKGAASEGYKTFTYIYQTWLPASGYVLDNRPHFEVLGEKYKHEQADSEEEIWIPIKKV